MSSSSIFVFSILGFDHLTVPLTLGAYREQPKLPGDHRVYMKVGVNRKGRNARNEDDAFTDGKSRTG